MARQPPSAARGMTTRKLAVKKEKKNEIVDVKEECFESIRGNHYEPVDSEYQEML